MLVMYAAWSRRRFSRRPVRKKTAHAASAGGAVSKYARIAATLALVDVVRTADGQVREHPGGSAATVAVAIVSIGQGSFTIAPGAVEKFVLELADMPAHATEVALGEELPVGDAAELLVGSSAPAGKAPVCVTFDDGTADFLDQRLGASKAVKGLAKVGETIVSALVSGGRVDTKALREFAHAPFRYAPGEGCGECAPTLRRSDGSDVRGLVHDENAWAMGGIAGHAGLFSTAADLAPA